MTNTKKPKEDVAKPSKSSKSVPIIIMIIAAILLIAPILLVVKVPYTAKESYTEIVSKITPVTKTVEDKASSYQIRVCDPAKGPTISSHEVYGREFGLNGFKCFASFKAMNNEEVDKKYSYRYYFIVNGKEFPVDIITQTVPRISSLKYNFEYSECKSGDQISGRYDYIPDPSSQVCRYETHYNNKTITVDETALTEVKKERDITNYRSVWQTIFG
jgi:Tfp pilus assembly major pilin PilA